MYKIRLELLEVIVKQLYKNKKVLSEVYGSKNKENAVDKIIRENKKLIARLEEEFNLEA